MSQSPPPIPIPAIIEPLPAIPVTNVPAFAHRPGIVTAIGWLSIVVCVATMALCFAIFIGCTVMFARAQSGAASRAIAKQQRPATRITVAKPAQEIFPVDPMNGLGASKRSAVLSALSRVRPMSSARRDQANALLSQAGQRMFPMTAATAVDLRVVQNNVTAHGVLPSARGGEGPTYFVIGTGRVEIYDDHAVFRPTGSADVVSVRAADLKKEARGQSAANQAAAATPVNVKTVKADVIPLSIIAIESLVSGCLAIYLLITGILTLRQNLSARTMQWVYFWIKLPLALIAIGASWKLYDVYATAATRNPGVQLSFETTSALTILSCGVAALVYLIVLAMMLKSRDTRDYYLAASQDTVPQRF
ncbi:MAG TPA: hypothetical protein VF669_06745 [Tepidisphaeraceae bacterium]|jgi:hypothetical protein